MKWEPFFHSETVYDLTLNYCGLENCEPMFVMPPHIREEYLVHYIISGEGIFVTPEKQYNVKSGDIFIIYPGKPVSYRTNPDNPFHFSWFSFTGASSETVVSELGFSHNNCVRHLHSKYSIQDDILECVNILDSKWPPNDFLITSILYRILYKISESYRFDSVNHIGKSKITGEHIMRATAFIKLNYMNPINVGDVAQFVGLEHSYFSKAFHAYTGMTAQKYLTEVRINRSRELLEQTSYTIKEICSFVGIDDECYFSRIFKKNVGIPPREYRRMILSDFERRGQIDEN